MAASVPSDHFATSTENARIGGSPFAWEETPDYQHDAAMLITLSSSSRAILSSSLLALLDYFAYIRNRPYLNRSKSKLKARKL